MSRATQSADLRLLCDSLVMAYRKGNLPEAEKLALQIKATEAAQFEANHILGVLRARQERHAEALDLILSALKTNPRAAEAWRHHGNVLKAMGHAQQAEASYDRAAAAKAEFGALYNRARSLRELRHPQEALAKTDQAVAIGPYNTQAWILRANALLDLNRFDDALESFNRALAIEPDFVEGLYNRAQLLQRLKRHEEALADYDRVLVLRPDFAEAHNNRGIALWCLLRFEEAAGQFRKALALQPDLTRVLANLGSVLCEAGQIDEGMTMLSRHAEKLYGNAHPIAEIPSHKLKHDSEQLAYLTAQGIAGIGEGANLKFRVTDGAKLAGPAINPVNVGGAVDEEWRSKNPKIVVIDNLLTPDALKKIREYCAGSTVWRKIYGDGYLGAMAEDGLASPLLGQIAEEMRNAFPAIFRDLTLRHLWAFKYDSSLKGIAIHADEAAVNVNFWITPDEANLDPASGGLVVWDVAAPLDWDFAKYNSDNIAIREFLERHNAKSVTIPYRANRAVIFDSDLFHETDTIRFRDGYLNRRINVTLLYGRRELGADSHE